MIRGVSPAINNSLPWGDRAWPIMEPTHVALIRLLEGTQEPDDALQVGMALNLASTRLRLITGSAAGVALIAQAGLLLMQCQDAPDGLASLPRAGKQVVIEAVELYDETMRKSTPLQMEFARAALERAILGEQKKRKVRRA